MQYQWVLKRQLLQQDGKHIFDVLAQGGTPEQASAAAYKACGSACDNY